MEVRGIEVVFAGFVDDAALGVSVRTVQRDWIRARAWLYHYFFPDLTP